MGVPSPTGSPCAEQTRTEAACSETSGLFRLSLRSRWSPRVSHNPTPPPAGPGRLQRGVSGTVTQGGTSQSESQEAGRPGQGEAAQVTREGKGTLRAQAHLPAPGRRPPAGLPGSPRSTTRQEQKRKGPAPPRHPAYMRGRITFVQK